MRCNGEGPGEMDTLRKLKDDLWSHFQDYSRSIFRASRFVKVVLIIGGATLASVALTIDIAHANHEISPWTIAGLAAAALVAVGGIFDTLRETDASKALVAGHHAVEVARQREKELEEMIEDHGRFDTAVVRGLELYNSMDVMRGAIEQSLSLPDTSVSSIIQTCLSAAGDSLLVAFGFDIKDIWTICVFMAQPDSESGKVSLRCVAHMRKIPCDISQARSWPEGVGVAGIAYSTNHEIIIQDMSSPEVSAVFDLGAQARSYDKDRYASMVAVPVTVGANPKPWGVAVVTTDRPDHFSPEPSYGVATAEPIRAIASMTALAVKAAEVRRR